MDSGVKKTENYTIIGILKTSSWDNPKNSQKKVRF